MKKMLVAAASTITGALLLVSAASAKPSSSSLQLVVLSGASAPVGAAAIQPQFGGQVTFDLQTKASEPWVSVVCYQGGAAVYGQYWGFWSGYDPPVITNAMAADGVFTLGPTAFWSSGSASCTATLSTFGKNHKETVLATLPFTVGA